MVKSIVFFTKQFGIKSAIAIILMLLLIAGCVNKKNKMELFVKKQICNGLWREKYIVFSGGAYSADLYSDYITDSTNFRIYIGTHDETSNYDYQCKGDIVVVRKFIFNENKVSTIVENNTFNISELRKEHKFE